MNALIPLAHGQVGPRLLDAARLIERWSEGRSKQTLRAYSNDLRHFSDWLGGFLGTLTPSTAQAVTILLTKAQGEANEIVRAYRSAMVERGLSPSTINRKLSALRSLVAPARSLASSPSICRPATCALRPIAIRAGPNRTPWPR
jgi:hypothetical protein